METVEMERRRQAAANSDWPRNLALRYGVPDFNRPPVAAPGDQAFARRTVPQPVGPDVDCTRLKLKAGEPSELSSVDFADTLAWWQKAKSVAICFCMWMAGLQLGLALSAIFVEDRVTMFFSDPLGLLLVVLSVVASVIGALALKAPFAPVIFTLAGLLLGVSAASLADRKEECCFFVDWKPFCIFLSMCSALAAVLVAFYSVDNEVRREFRERLLVGNFDKTDHEAAWPHVHVNPFAGSSREGTTRNELHVEDRDVWSFWLLVARAVLHGALFWRSMHIARSGEGFGGDDGFVKFWQDLIAAAELVVWVLCWVRFIAHAAFLWLAKTSSTTRANRVYAMACGLKGAATLSAFRLVAYIRPVSAWTESAIAATLNYRLGAHRSTLSRRLAPGALVAKLNERQGCLYSVLFTGALAATWLLAAALGLLAIVVKVQQLDFLTDQQFEFLDLIFLGSLASQLMGIQDLDHEGDRVLATGLQDATDLENVGCWGVGARGSRILAWKKALCKKAIEQRSAFAGLVSICTLDASKLARILLGVRSIQAEDRVISNGFGSIPWGYQGVVVKLEPLPCVRWDGLVIPREVMVEFRKDEKPGRSGCYKLQAPNKKQQQQDSGWWAPIYKKVDGPQRLSPVIQTSLGSRLLPLCEGWGITDTDGGPPAVIWKTPVEYSPECLKHNVTCTPVKESGEEQLVWFTQMSHISLLWGSTCGSFAVW